ncbi:alkaline phosphatase synthesis transcriptional regulatory protein [Corallococcus coralloides DSM 2259]|uniref:Alkaline phosphatase synthesis transcriptional regulatory protein n=1 Tax=Corallococcus coralloides (strain ATCC 25202 / DSM 2259 / NBRC 100086 / M2) TaxID=1144275 RepID=H8MP00_CORCM|nr:response regulator [Corallococcus coralloides]AFE09823.1 alkaline phosphatase synthesis transcriptional regulatory protein [Corallococcus coralloides DSM 2259]
MSRILVVEDEETLADAIQDVLQDAGFEVQVARNGLEALRKLEAGVPDVLLLDLMLPLMDGRGLLKRMRDQERLRELPVVVMTSASRKALGEHPVRSFLPKPVTAVGLLKAVKSVLPGAEG